VNFQNIIYRFEMHTFLPQLDVEALMLDLIHLVVKKLSNLKEKFENNQSIK
jgi:hypothetical protein